MLVDADLLSHKVDSANPFHDRSREWLTAQLNSGSRVAIPWQSLAAFLRIVTHPRASKDPLSPGVTALAFRLAALGAAAGTSI